MKVIKKVAMSITVLTILVAMLPLSAFAEEKSNTTSCIGISAPYKYNDFNNVSFAVFFDQKITDVNYKHLACSATVLKTMSYWDNPNMTPAIIDELDAAGIIESMNDYIAFNGKKVREWQKTSQLACMILVGELGENTQMNIDFNGAIDEVKIEDLEQPFEITLYKGLKFPSGVELAETQVWQYDPEVGTFSERKGSADVSDAGFSAYYNGTVLEGEFNTAEVYNGEFFEKNICVYPNNPDTEIVIEPQFDKMESGYNYVYITSKAPDGVTTERMQLILDNTYEKPPTQAQTTFRYIKVIAIPVLLLLGAAMCIMIFAKRGTDK